MERPYSQVIENDIMIRNFSDNIDPIELKWHRDEKDRTVIALNENDWKFQFDNELPKMIKGKIYIRKGVFHRLIKGDNDRKIRLTKL